MSRKAVLFGMALALLSSLSCQRLAPRGGAPDVSYLPSDCMVVVAVETARLRQAPLYQKLNPEPGQLKTFLLRLGIDPERDLDQVMFAFRAAGTEQGEWLAVLRGRFDRARIEKGMEDPAARMSVESYRRWNVYNLVRVPDIGDLSFAVVDSGASVLGKSEAIRKVLDVRDKSAPSLDSNETARRLLRGLDPASQIWGVLDGKEMTRLAQQRRQALSGTIPEKAIDDLSLVVDARLWAVVTEDLGITLEIGSGTEKGAKTLSDAIRGILAFARMGSAGRDPDAAALVEAISVSEKGNGVQVRLSLSGDAVRKLRERIQALSAGGEPAPGS